MSSIPSSLGSAANSSSTAVPLVRSVPPLEPNTVSAPQPANEDVDEALVAHVDKKIVAYVDGKLKDFDFMFRKRSLRRKMIVLGIPISYSTGTSLKKTGSTSSSVHTGELSVAGRDALIHLNRIIEEYDDLDEEYTFTRFLERVEMIPCHQLNDDECENRFDPPLQSWQLILVAAMASAQVYNDTIRIHDEERGEVTPPRSYVKAVSVFSLPLNNKRVLVVAVRGTVGLIDWFVNFNGEPKRSPNLLQGVNKWHSGFLVVALAMQDKVATLIATEIQEQQCDSVIFTGHSAGAAIAQIFFAMTKTADSRLAASVSSVPEIHCISFATPPVADTSIPHGTETDKPGLFINIINEGDLVPLAQENYMYCLLDVFALPEREFITRRENFRVPPPVLYGSGDGLILRDADRNLADSAEIEACIVERRVLDTKLFGNPFVHSMKIYLERIEKLVGQAGVENLTETVRMELRQMDRIDRTIPEENAERSEGGEQGSVEGRNILEELQRLQRG